MPSRVDLGKSEQYQDDLYPDTVAPTPALTAEEWIKGINRDPVVMSMKTGTVLREYSIYARFIIQYHTVTIRAVITG